MERRDLLLQQMGIDQWQLHRPEVLKGAVNIPVAAHIRLIVIAAQVPDVHDSLLRDILHSAELSATDCLFIDFAQLTYLNVRHPLNYWLLEQNQEKIDRTLPLCKQPLNLWQSPELSVLKQNPSTKRRLWQYIQTTLSERY